jgi:hypothetical protein
VDVNKLIAEMEVAMEADMEAHHNNQPAVSKLRMLGVWGYTWFIDCLLPRHKLA